MVVNNWNRHPKGNADGGKFAPEPSTESTVELSQEPVPLESDTKAFEEEFGSRARASEPEVEEDVPPARNPIKLGGAVEYADSWRYPPPPTLDTAKMAAYWSDVLIPDGALQNIENADRDRDFFLYEEEFDKWLSSNPSPSKRQRRKNPERFVARDIEARARKAIFESVQFSLGLIPRSELRDVARLGAFWTQASELGDESRAKAAAFRFVTSSGKVVSALDVVMKYRLREIDDAFFDRVRYRRPD